MTSSFHTTKKQKWWIFAVVGDTVLTGDPNTGFRPLVDNLDQCTEEMRADNPLVAADFPATVRPHLEAVRAHLSALSDYLRDVEQESSDGIATTQKIRIDPWSQPGSVVVSTQNAGAPAASTRVESLAAALQGSKTQKEIVMVIP